VLPILSGLPTKRGGAQLSGCGKSRRETGQLSAVRFQFKGNPEVMPPDWYRETRLW